MATSEPSDSQAGDGPVTLQDEPVGAAGGSSITLTATTEYACYSPATLQNCWAVTSFKAPLYEPSARASVDIVAVIDKSGSMSGQKIALVRETLLFVIDQLKESDRICLVVYDTNVELVFGLMKMTEQNRERARAYVSSIQHGSSTYLCGGLVKGMEQVALTNGGEKAQVQSVLLLTDGLANHGITNKAGIIDQMNKMQNGGLGAVTMPLNVPARPPQSRRQRNPFSIPLQVPPVQQQQQQAAPFPVQQPPIQLQQQVTPPPPPPPPQQQAPIQLQQGGPPPRPPRPPRPPPQQQAPIQLQQQGGPPPPPLPPPPPQQQAPIQLQQQEGPPPPPPPQSEENDATAGYKFDGTVYTFGFGSDHDADMLEAISTQGGGVYYYIDNNEKIPESFADCLGGLLSVMGQNVSVKLEAQGDTSFKKVHTSKAINWTTANKSCEVPMGDIQSEESRDLVLELELPTVVPSCTSSEQVPLVKAEVSYFNVITSQFDTMECQVTTNRTDGDHGPGNMTVDIQRNRVLAADALKRAEELGTQNKLKEAQDMLKECVSALQASISKEEGLVKLLVLDLNKCLEAMKTRESFSSHGKKYMRSKMQSHAVQRSNFVYEEEDQELEGFGYGNMSKAAYRSKAKKK